MTHAGLCSTFLEHLLGHQHKGRAGPQTLSGLAMRGLPAMAMVARRLLTVVTPLIIRLKQHRREDAPIGVPSTNLREDTKSNCGRHIHQCSRLFLFDKIKDITHQPSATTSQLLTKVVSFIMTRMRLAPSSAKRMAGLVEASYSRSSKYTTVGQTAGKAFSGTVHEEHSKGQRSRTSVEGI